ncbi:MAG TPA: proteinase inhibitor I4 serpin [Clostridiales bacterium UBA8153]|nr:proteinase inhibitor I4 serpin [Clostridiales bacterium UBA8153]
MNRRFSTTVLVAVLMPGLILGWLGFSARMRLVAAPAGPERNGEVNPLSRAYTGFALKLLSRLVDDHPQENVLFSPASVAVALAMTYHGAAGETRKDMARVLGVQDLELAAFHEANRHWLTALEAADPKARVTLANSLWARQGFPFHESFLETNRRYYAAHIQQLDFEHPGSPDTINAWVRQKTRNKIAGIVDRIDRDHLLFLINAIHFKGSWSTRFERAATRDGSFTLADGTPVTHPLMSRTGRFQYYQGDGFQAVRLPYGAGRTGMYVFLPSTHTGLAGLVDALTPETWARSLAGFGEAEGYLVLPRFRMETKYELAGPLKALGMELAFDPEQADFSAMCPVPPNVYIGSVKHKAVVDVDEEGTEAAAVTSVEIRVESMPRGFHMVVDRPFLFAIRDDKTGMILFMGTVLDPR